MKILSTQNNRLLSKFHQDKEFKYVKLIHFQNLSITTKT